MRVSAGIEPEHQLFSLADFIAEVKRSATLEAEVKGCELTVSIVDPDLAVDADKDLLLAAVGNLLQNAFKFTCHHTEVTLNAYSMADRIFIDVEDQCGGLPPNFADKMFRPSTQGGVDQPGLGLGLSISKRNVEANEGTLSVRDVPGVGCIFTINLPRYSMPQTSIESAGSVEEPDPVQPIPLSTKAKKLRILITEDSPPNRKLLEGLLERLGVIPPVMVENGQLAVTLALTGAFEVVLMDCHMPVLNGYEAAR